MISTAESGRRVIAAPAPVLLSDTCALLDLIREPTREGFTGAHVHAAKRLLSRAEATPKTLWIAVTDQVRTELNDHSASIEQGAVAAIQRLEDTVHRVRAIMLAYGLSTTAPDLVAAGLPALAQRVLQRCLQAGLHISTPKGAKTGAWARIAANIPPAQKGQQAKDCIVLESYLTLARELRNKGVVVPIVFLTTNTRDYSDPANKATVHPTLASEFAALQIRYAVNFGMAEQLLK